MSGVVSGAFRKRQINLQFQLTGAETFNGTNSNTLSLSGLRMNASVTKTGQFMSVAELTVYGMTLSQINQLTVIGFGRFRPENNTITLLAGDVGGSLSDVFDGTILSAFFDGDVPDAGFHVSARTAYLLANAPVAPASFNGGADAAVILAQMAKQAGLGFINNGVSVQLSNAYYPGTIWAQIAKTCEHANVNFAIERNTLEIWPASGSRNSNGTKTIVSPATGMVGWPQFSGNGIELRTLFNPTIRFGDIISVRSELTAACGDWLVTCITHNLAAETVGGPWFSQISAFNTKAAVPQLRNA